MSYKDNPDWIKAEVERQLRGWDDFMCQCGKMAISRDPEAPWAICEECCENSEDGCDYTYERSLQRHACKKCGGFPPDDWWGYDKDEP